MAASTPAKGRYQRSRSVTSPPVGGSAHMEKERLARSLQFLQSRGLSPDAIVTDRQPQIQKYIRDAVPSVKHYYDVWHVAKGKGM